MTVHVAVATFVVYHSTVARLEALYNIGSKLPHIYMKMVEDGNYFTSYIYIYEDMGKLGDIPEVMQPI